MLRSRVIFSPIREGASLSILHSLGSTTSVASLLKLFHVANRHAHCLLFSRISHSLLLSLFCFFISSLPGRYLTCIPPSSVCIYSTLSTLYGTRIPFFSLSSFLSGYKCAPVQWRRANSPPVSRIAGYARCRLVMLGSTDI